MVHKAKCLKLKDVDAEAMTKEELVAHLVKSKCPEIAKLVNE